MAYAAVVSLKQTLDHLSNSSDLRIVSCHEVITGCAGEVEYLENVLQCLDLTIKSRSRKRVNDLDEQNREVVSRFEDVLESSLSNQIAKQSDENGSKNIQFVIEMQSLKQGIQSFTTRMKKMEEVYLQELRKMVSHSRILTSELFLRKNFREIVEEEVDEEEEDDDLHDHDQEAASSKVIGLCNELRKRRVQLTSRNKWEARVRVIAVLGMAGIGKTTLANEVFEDPDISDYFDRRVRVRVGVKWDPKKMFQDILSQVNPEIKIEGIDEEMSEYMKNEKLAHYLERGLEGKSYLIVLDDVWDEQGPFYESTPFPKKWKCSIGYNKAATSVRCLLW